ncbi:MAG TPA: hypothetical protein VHN80_23940 [Kineosporiaceae bacterium]|jgi:hypothetical protein|nr:hypothetical protein [Kineosporiaceae bacterium]
MSSSTAVVPRLHPASALVATGAACGTAWAAGLRGWMIQMAGGQSTTFTWYGTFGLLIGPGAVVGAAFGYAEYRRRTGGVPSRWLTLTPLAFLSALTVPWIFRALITSGQGGGAIGVTLFGLAGGHALSGRGRPWARRASGVAAVVGVLLMAVMAGESAPLGTARGAWVSLYASSLMAVLCLACAVPHRIGQSTALPAWAAVAIGALVGLAWSATLRAFMWEVAGDAARADAVGTLAFVLLPGAVIGAVLSGVEWQRRRGPLRHRRWVVWTPMLFAAVLLQNPADLIGGFAGGVGLAAVAVPGLCMIGGYGLSGHGPRPLRAVCILVLIAAVPAWALTATTVGGPGMSLTTPHGAWGAVLYWSLLVTFSIAAGLPHRTAAAAAREERPIAAAGHASPRTAG